LTPFQIEFSKKLSEGEKLETLAEWKVNKYSDSKSEEANRRLDKLLSEVEALESKTIAKQFLERAAMIAQETSSNHRSLLIDSFILDLVKHSNDRKKKDAIIASMRKTRSELRRFSSNTTKELINLLTKAIDSQDVLNANLFNERGLKILKEETAVASGTARREAILHGLGELGYEVQENMATAWAENGRIIVKKPNEKIYGVELGSVAKVLRRTN
jgi:hypothetical protein